MKQQVWIADYLINDGNEVKGYKTVVEGNQILTAAYRTQVHITENFDPRNTRYFITDIGLAGEDARIHIGKVLEDGLAIEWPEELEVER